MNCPKCGNPMAFGADTCEDCGYSISAQPVETAPDQITETDISTQKPDNVVTGTVGAIIGAVIGGAAIILLSQLGYVAAISGLILAVCTLKGYELLGGRLSTRGIVICIVIMLVAPYIADRIDWAILVMQEFADEGVTFGEAFAAIPFLIEEEAIELSGYLLNLALIYVFAIVGAFSTLYGVIKKKK